MHSFQPYPIDLLELNPFHKIGKEWMLITAGNEDAANTMTASWGGVGVLWAGIQLLSLSVNHVTPKSSLITGNPSP